MKKFTVLIIVLALLLLPLGCSIGKKTLPSPARQRPAVGGFYVNEPGPNDSLPSLRGHSNVLDEIYPLWYHVRPDGSLKEEPVPEAISFAHRNGIKILPLINVVPSQDSVLRSPQARDNAIGNIMRIVKANNYDGVNVDFEFVPTTGRKDFSVDRQEMTTFMRLLNGRLKQMGKITHMCVLPLVGVSINHHRRPMHPLVLPARSRIRKALAAVQAKAVKITRAPFLVAAMVKPWSAARQ